MNYVFNGSNSGNTRVVSPGVTQNAVFITIHRDPSVLNTWEQGAENVLEAGSEERAG